MFIVAAPAVKLLPSGRPELIDTKSETDTTC